jgi:hypothetical protein
MAANPKDHLSIDVAPELRQKIEDAASKKNMPWQEYVISILQQAVVDVEPDHDRAAWERLSADSFARDWSSEEDRVYDSLS